MYHDLYMVSNEVIIVGAQQRDFSGVSIQFVGCFQNHRLSQKLGMTHNPGKGFFSQVALPNLLVAVLVAADGILCIVQMQSL